MRILIVVADLVHHHRTPQGITEALRGVSLTIEQGEFVAIIAIMVAKSTLAAHLNVPAAPRRIVTVTLGYLRKKENPGRSGKGWYGLSNPDKPVNKLHVLRKMGFRPGKFGY